MAVAELIDACFAVWAPQIPMQHETVSRCQRNQRRPELMRIMEMMQQAVADDQIRRLPRMSQRQKGLVVAQTLPGDTGCAAAIISHGDHPISAIKPEN